MDNREKYMSTIIRTLIRGGVLTFVSTAASSVTLGPAGFVIGPAITAAEMFLNRSSLVESRQGLAGLTGNQILQLALRVACVLVMENYQAIVQICRDIISLLRRFFTGGQTTSRIENVMVPYRNVE